MKLALILAGIAIAAIAIGIWTSSSPSSGTGSGQYAASSSTGHAVNTTPRVTTYQIPEAPSAHGRPSSGAVTNRRTPPPLPPRSLANPARKEYVPPRGTPPLPVNRVSVNSRIYDYPKCPICRIRNIRGESQNVFWKPTQKKYCCTNGHYFAGKEV